MLLTVRQILSICHNVTLTFDSKITLVIWIAYCYLHTIGNHCAKYEHPRSRNEKGVCGTSPKTYLSICDHDLRISIIDLGQNKY